MKIINPSIVCLYPSHEDAEKGLLVLEKAGRTCYKSEDKATEDSAPNFVEKIIKRGHESVIEHISACFRIICDRGVTHEIVRHRLASYSQESTRYVNYGHAGEIQFIDPSTAFPNMSEIAKKDWETAVGMAEMSYLNMVSAGCPPELARSVLPNSVKTEIVMTANLREWRHFCKLRCSKKAHPQMREVAKPILVELYERWPSVFGDLYADFIGGEAP